MSFINQSSLNEPNLEKQFWTGSIYTCKNDPKQTRKGVKISNFTDYEGKYLPLLTDIAYIQRKYQKNNYNYDTKRDHGNRAMHDTTLTLTCESEKNDYLTKHQLDYKRYQLYPDKNLSTQRCMFKSQFDLGESSNERSLSTTYSQNFSILNKEKMNQIEKGPKTKIYNNGHATVRDSLIHDKNENSYWTNYNRTHGLLGARLGSGVAKLKNKSPNYNIITGEKLNSSDWKITNNYNCITGNNVLFSANTNI